MSRMPDGTTTRSLLTASAAVALGVIVFLWAFGDRILDPGQVDWLLVREDTSTYFLGWSFFRGDPWQLPLGWMESYLAPAGTSVGQTDSIPLVAIALKPLRSLLPEPFQYFGLWILTSYVLMAFFGYLVLRRYLPNRWILLLGCLLLLLNPLVMRRQAGHIALGSHWLIVAGLWLYLRGRENEGRWSGLLWWIGLIAVTAAIHPYLTVMVFGLGIAWVVRLDRFSSWRDGLVAPGRAALLAATVLAVLLLVGTISPWGPAPDPAVGFGYFSMNLNAPFNPEWTSDIFPGLPEETNGQYEGYNYFGAGILLAAVMALALALLSPPRPRSLLPHLPLALFLILCTAFAASNTITLGDRVLGEYPVTWLPEDLTTTLRASGRFFWPVYYMVVIGAIATIGSRFRPPIAALVLACLAGIQFYEFRGLAGANRARAEEVYETRLTSPAWSESADAFDHLVTVPPYAFSTLSKGDFADLGYLALRNGQTIGTGYAARASQEAVALRTAEIEEELRSPDPDPRTLYVFRDDAFAREAPEIGDRFVFAVIDGYITGHVAGADFEVPGDLVPRSMDLPSFLDSTRDFIVILTARDEATAALSETDRRALENAGFPVDEVAYRDSWIAISRGGESLWHERSGERKLVADFEPGTELGGTPLRSRMRLRSGGFLHGRVASIEIDGIEYARGLRGLNFCILDDRQQVVGKANFDTHVTSRGAVLLTPDFESND